MSKKHPNPILAEEVVAHAASAKVNRDVGAYGLDPRVFCAVLEAVDVSRFGIVNKNRRILPEELGQAEIDKFNERCSREAVAGDDGHPTWERYASGEYKGMACVWLSAETYRDEAGVLRARANVALLNTQTGQDLAIICEAGIKLGTSSRAMATFDDVYLDEKSGWLNTPENKRFKDQWIDLYTSWSLGTDGTFDFVRNPSANTFAESATESVKQAFENLVSSNILKEVGMPADTITMSREEHNKLVAEATAAAATASATENATLREALEAQKATVTKLNEQVVALEAKAAAAEKAAAEAATKVALDAFILESANEAHGTVIKGHLELLRGKGRLATVEDAKEQVEVLKEALEKAQVKPQTTTPAPSAKADRADEAAPAAAPPSNIMQSLSEVLK
jgi:hypothetical protein